MHRRTGWRVIWGPTARSAFTVEKALDIGQEGDELTVVALIEVAWVIGEFVVDSLPVLGVVPGLENLPMTTPGTVNGQWLELQRP
jgi:hypothetical protein